MGFFKRLKNEVWKVVRAILMVGIVITIVITVVTYGKKINRPENVKMIIDSDSGNEIDDLFAITLSLIDPKIDLIGITSAQWHRHPLANDSTVFISQQLNEEILRLHNKSEIPHPRGENIGRAYVRDKNAAPSDAVRFIIDEVKKLKYREKLNVVTLGAVTNLATAIQLDSSIASKICWYGIGLKYNDRDRIWDKNEFNTQNDLNGMDYLLNREDLETHIMTATTSKVYTFEKTETKDLMQHRGPKWDFLIDRWDRLYPDRNTWIMWDIALIHAIMNPDLVTEKEVWTPDENLRKRIYVYTWIDEEKMMREFRKLVRKDMEDISSDIE